jgi:hypothetical protein
MGLREYGAERELPGTLGMGRLGGGPAGRTLAADERRRCEKPDDVDAKAEGGAADEEAAGGSWSRGPLRRGWLCQSRDE